MHLCVFEDDLAEHFIPLVHTRAIYDLRLGIRTLLEAIREAFGNPGTILHARGYVAAATAYENNLLVNKTPSGIGVLYVNGRWIVEEGDVLDRVRQSIDTPEPRVFTSGEVVVAAWVPDASSRYIDADAVTLERFEGLPTEEVDGLRMVKRMWDLGRELDAALHRDYRVRTEGLYIYERPGVEITEGAHLVNAEQIYVGPGAVISAGAVVTAEEGPVYIGEGATIEPGAVIKGPAYIGPKCEVMTGADVERCSFGYWSKVGGQVQGTIIHSLSNKAHSGYLGDAYIGRWCNLGADTNNSNLRNDYGEVKMYDCVARDFVPTGRQFLGLIMADHSKSGINTMFNTGAVVGVCCNLFGAGFMPRCVPSFSWGGPEGFSEFRLDKALRVADAVMRRRERELTDAERENLEAVFEVTRGESVRN